MRRLTGFLVALTLSFVGVLHAQSTSASLTGYVTDPSKAVIVGAKVVVINVGTNTRYEALTNETGSYDIPNLPPGTYRIEVEKPGFKTTVKSDVVLHVQDTVAINFEMAVGSTSEIVTVTGGAPLINTESGAVSTVVDRQFVENMPLNGRSFQALIALTPGVVLTAVVPAEPGQFSVNGQRADANYFTVDGVSANVATSGNGGLGQSAAGALPGFSASGGTNTLVSVDAMQEFRIQTSSFAPEFGRTPGGQISIVTRSGTNQFHGVLFDYFRNDVLDANNWFADRDGLPKPKERQNDFGATFSGPILKDRTFFFFSYEGLRLRRPKTAITTVPSVRVRRAAPSQIQPFLNAFPVPTPNGAEFLDPNGNPTGLAPFKASYSEPSSLDAYSIRADHMISSKLSLFGRYNNAPSEAATRNSVGLSQTSITHLDTQTITLGLTTSFSMNINDELRANYSNVRNRTFQRLDSIGGATPPFDSVLFPSGFSSTNGFFLFTVGFAGDYAFAVGKGFIGEQRQVNLVDNLTVMVGAHQLKFGVDYRWLAPFNSPRAYSQSPIFAGTTGVLSGVAAIVQISANGGNALLSQNLSLYGQDSWRITPRLALTYGLRWDVNPPLRGKNGNNNPFTVEGLDNPATMTLAPRGTPLYATTYGNVAPRLGVAFQLDQRENRASVLRGGLGVFYDLGGGSLGSVTSGFPYTTSKLLTSVPFPLAPQQAAPPPLSLNPPVSMLTVADPNLKLPRTYQWNVALVQALGSRQVFSVTYVGAVSRHQLRNHFLASPNATFNQVFVITNSATSDYQSLQLQVQRRVSRGLQALASYTWSHSIDNASRDSGFFSAPFVSNPKLDRGNSDFDVRHTFTSAITYDVPTAGRRRVVRAILGEWSLDSFLIARSATPVDLAGRTNFVSGTRFSARPDLFPDRPLYLFGPQFPGGKAINPAAFVLPRAGRQGTLGRNVLRGFGAWQADFALRRQFHLTERVGLQFRAEFFNIFNHPNFGNPTTLTLGSPQFGLSRQTLADSLSLGGAGFNPLYQVGAPRSSQFALKVKF